MKKEELLEKILNELEDIIILEDQDGNILINNHEEIDIKKLIVTENNEYHTQNQEKWFNHTKKNIKLKDNENYIMHQYRDITETKQMKQEWEKDSKTGLLQSEAFQKQLELETKKNKFILAIFDIDQFKQINDTYGHTKADEVLQQIGIIIKKSTRSSDLSGRFGGDEFVIAFKSVNLEIGKLLLQRLKNNIQKNVKIDDQKINCTISIGCTEYDQNMTYHQNLEKADKALYESKTSGRNRIKIYK